MPTLPTLPALPAEPTRENLADWMCDVEAFREELADHVAALLDHHAAADTLAPALNTLFEQALAGRAEPLTAIVLASGCVNLINESSGDGVEFVPEQGQWWLAPRNGEPYARPSDGTALHVAAADYATGFEWWSDPAQMQVMAGALLRTA